MPRIQNNFLRGKMNKDLDERLVPKGEYREAQNLLITHSEDSDVGALENVLGNAYALGEYLIRPEELSKGEAQVIGHYADVLNNRIFWFITNFSGSSGDNINTMAFASTDHLCRILIADLDNISNNSIKVLVNGGFLNFSRNHLITGVNLIDDLLFWTDNYNQPRKINISTALANPNYYNSEEKISVAKFAPYQAIILVDSDGGGHDATLTTLPSIESKYLEDRFVKFSYRFKFEDGEYSTIAPFTQTVFAPLNSGRIKTETNVDYNEENIYNDTTVDLMENKYNKIQVRIPLPSSETLSPGTTSSWSNDLKIKKIELLVKESHRVNIKIAGEIDINATFGDIITDTSENGTEIYTVTPVDTASYARYAYRYSYKSEEPFKVLPEVQTTRVYDHVPIRAKAQEISGNRIIYGNYTENHPLPKDESGKTGINYVINNNSKGDQEHFNTFGVIQNLKNAYKYHSVKQRRNYQVGVILADKFGRQSTVILSTNTDNAFLSDTFRVPAVQTTQYDDDNSLYTWSQNAGIEAIGKSLNIQFNDSRVVPTNQTYNGDINSPDYNPYGWYSWRIVVKQKEQNYYNVYTTHPADSWNADSNSVDVSDAGRTWLSLHGDNVNKVPRIRSTDDVVDPAGATPSEIRLFPKVVKNSLTSSYGDSVIGSDEKPVEIISIGTAREHGLLKEETEFNKSEITVHDFIRTSKRNPVVAKLSNLATSQSATGNNVSLHTTATVKDNPNNTKLVVFKSRNPYVKVGQYVRGITPSGGVAMIDDFVVNCGPIMAHEDPVNTKQITFVRNSATQPVNAASFYSASNPSGVFKPLDKIKVGQYIRTANEDLIETNSNGDEFRPTVVEIKKNEALRNADDNDGWQEYIITLDRAVGWSDHSATDVYFYDFTTVLALNEKEESGVTYQEVELSRSQFFDPDTVLYFRNIDNSPVAPKAIGLSVFETEPSESKLDIFYETSTSGLVSDLNLETSVEFESPYGLAISNNSFSESTYPSDENDGVIGELSASEVTGADLGFTFTVIGVESPGNPEGLTSESFEVNNQGELVVSSQGFVWDPIDNNNNKFNVTIQYTENGGGTAQDTIDLELTNSEPSISVNETEVSISNTSIEDTQVFTAAIRNGTANTELDDKFLQVVLSNPRSADGTVLNAGSNIIDTTYYNTTETPPIAGPEFGINYGMFKHSIENGVLTVKTTGYFNGAWFFENTNINVEDNIPEMAASEEDRTITFTVYDGGVDFTTEDDGFTDSYKLAEGSMIVNRGGARIAGKMWKIEGDISNSTFTNTCSEDVWNMTQIDVWIEEWSGPEPFAENNNFILTIAPNNRVWLSSSGNDVSNYLPDGFYKYVSSTTEDVDNFGNTIGITSNYSVIEVEDGIIQLDQDCN